MRPKNSPAPGERSESSASHTVISTYSAVNSSAAAWGSTRSSRSIIRSRHAPANASRALGGELGEADAGRHGPNTLPLTTGFDVSVRSARRSRQALAADRTEPDGRHRADIERHGGIEPPDCDVPMSADGSPLRILGLMKWFGDTLAIDGLDARRPARLVLRAGRPERQRQVDDAAFGDRARPARRRDDRGVRHRRRHRRAGGAAHDRASCSTRCSCSNGSRPASSSTRWASCAGSMPPIVVAERSRRAVRRRCNWPTMPTARSPATATACARRRRWRRRVLHRPRLLLLDEPFEGVDPVSARTMRAMLDRFRSGGGTVVLSSHVMDLVERLCDHVGVIHRGQRRRQRADRHAAQRSPPRGRVHRRRRRHRRRSDRRWPGWADPASCRRACAGGCLRGLLLGAIRQGGTETGRAVIVSTVASVLIGVGHRRRQSSVARAADRRRREPVRAVLRRDA